MTSDQRIIVTRPLPGDPVERFTPVIRIHQRVDLSGR